MKKSKMIREIPLNEIITGDNYRRPENIEQIAISIKSQGQLSPVLVLKKNEGYLLIDGNRRYHGILFANKSLGTDIKTIEAILIDEKLDDNEKSLLQMVMNETLDSPLERAVKIVELLEKGMPAVKIAEAFGVRDAYVYALKRKIVPDEIFRAYLNNSVILRAVDKDSGTAYYGTGVKDFETLFSENPESMKTLTKVSPGEERIKLFALDVIAETYYSLKNIERVDLFHELIVTLQHKKIYNKKQIEGYCRRTLEKVNETVKTEKTKKESTNVMEFSSKIIRLFKSAEKIDDVLIGSINQSLRKDKIPVEVILKQVKKEV